MDKVLSMCPQYYIVCPGSAGYIFWTRFKNFVTKMTGLYPFS